jgi:SM-20-related protein
MTATPPLFQIFEKLLPDDVHLAVWESCMAKRWYFGNQSTPQDQAIPFWKMDMEGVAPVDQLWQSTKAVCENLVGHPLTVARQYANGHTYGLGGRPHMDDGREGCFTLLYYPMPLWNVEWEGETLFFNPNGDVIGGVIPAPNRAVLFDSRMLHAGRAPSRLCPVLRVTVALKLEVMER